MIAKPATNVRYFVLLAMLVALWGPACATETGGAGTGLSLEDGTPSDEEPAAPEVGDDASGEPTADAEEPRDGSDEFPSEQAPDECGADGACEQAAGDEPAIDEGCLEEHVAQCLENSGHECEGAEHPDACHEELRAHCEDEWTIECTVSEGGDPGEGGGCVAEHTELCLAEAAGECEGAEHPDACHAELETSCHARAEETCL